MSEEIIIDGRVLSAQTKYLIVHDKLIDAAIKLLNKKSVETNVERKKENENFEGKNITPEKTDTKD